MGFRVNDLEKEPFSYRAWLTFEMHRLPFNDDLEAFATALSPTLRLKP